MHCRTSYMFMVLSLWRVWTFGPTYIAGLAYVSKATTNISKNIINTRFYHHRFHRCIQPFYSTKTLSTDTSPPYLSTAPTKRRQIYFCPC
ncbi:hypothetical protein F4819DRAFT_90159 [Hypoxylon fuscum]|nr:hypothetical protein F4819DRAFT_90159 [Hypoxylon fuscum]